MDSPTEDSSASKACASLASIPSTPRKTRKPPKSPRKSPSKPSGGSSSKSKPNPPSTLCKKKESFMDGIACKVSTSRGIFRPNLSDSEPDDVDESGSPQKRVRKFARVRTSPTKLLPPQKGLLGSQLSPAKMPVGLSKQPSNVGLFGLTPSSHLSPTTQDPFTSPPKTSPSPYFTVPSSQFAGPAPSLGSINLIVPVTPSSPAAARSVSPLGKVPALSSIVLRPQTVGFTPQIPIDGLSSPKFVLPPIPPASTRPRLTPVPKAAKGPFRFTRDLSPRCDIPKEIRTPGVLAMQLDSRGCLRLCLDLIDSEGSDILQNRAKFTENARAGPLGTLIFLPPKVRDRIYSHVFDVTDIPNTEAMFHVSPKLKSRYKKGKYRKNITITVYPHPNLAPLRHSETLFGEAADVMLRIFKNGEGKWDDLEMRDPKSMYNPIFHMALTEGSKNVPYYDTHLSVQGLKSFPFEQFQTVRLIAQRTRSIEHRVAVGDWIYKSNCVLPPKLTNVLPAIDVFSDGFVIQLSITPPRISKAFRRIHERDAPYDCFLGTAVSDRIKDSSNPKAHTHLAGADCNILKFFGKYITYTTNEGPTIAPNLHRKPEKLRVIDAYSYPRLSPGCSLIKRRNPELERVVERFEPLEDNAEAWFLLKPEPSRFHVSHANTLVDRNER